MHDLVKELVKLVEDGEPIGLSDEELVKLADAACDELRQRMPRYAFDQGDLPYDDPRAVELMDSAEAASSAVSQMRGVWLND